jgi:beta-N-acetylhexosaminidase
MHRSPSGPHRGDRQPGRPEAWNRPAAGGVAGRPGGSRPADSRPGSRPRPRKRWTPLGWAAVVVALGVGLGAALAAGRVPFFQHGPATASGHHGSGGAAGDPKGHGHAGSAGAAAGGGRTAAKTAKAASGASTAGGPNAALMAKLTSRQLAGQRVIYSYSGLTPPAGLLRLIRHGDAAGVIFFSQNISSESQIAAVDRELERADASSLNPVRAPLLLMTDQEGGLVRRLPGQPVLSEKQIGESAHPDRQARIAGAGAAANLRGVGMDVNLAPVLDVFRKPGDFDDQFQRSYSNNPRVVSRLGRIFIKAQQGGGVAATAKHFPGLGAATRNQDTDVRPVTLHLTRHQIRTIDEYPYRAAIGAGVKLVMVSWAVYPALDRSRPAGLSSTIVQGELRQRLGFRGVTITDALEAGALRPFGSTANRARLAAKAGMDLLLCAAQSVGQGRRALAALQAGYQDGQINKAAFRASVSRIISLRKSL